MAYLLETPTLHSIYDEMSDVEKDDADIHDKLFHISEFNFTEVVDEFIDLIFSFESTYAFYHFIEAFNELFSIAAHKNQLSNDNIDYINHAFLKYEIPIAVRSWENQLHHQIIYLCNPKRETPAMDLCENHFADVTNILLDDDAGALDSYMTETFENVDDELIEVILLMCIYTESIHCFRSLLCQIRLLSETFMGKAMTMNPTPEVIHLIESKSNNINLTCIAFAIYVCDYDVAEYFINHYVDDEIMKEISKVKIGFSPFLRLYKE